MVDASTTLGVAPRKKSSLLEADARTRRRNAAESRFKIYGIVAILIGLAFLVALLWAILSNGLGAFQQTFITVPVTISQEAVDAAEASVVKTTGYRVAIEAGFTQELARLGIETDMSERELQLLFSSSAPAVVRNYMLANPDKVGTPVEFQLLASSRVDGYLKGRVTREALALDKNLSAPHLDLADAMADAGILTKRFNWDFIFGTDASDSRPEQAGLGASMVGSLAMMLVVLVLSLPIGVAASIYLEEFAPKNRLTDLIEVNISNLAAVPSIVFGSSASPSSSSLSICRSRRRWSAAWCSTLMTLPTIIIATRCLAQGRAAASATRRSGSVRRRCRPSSTTCCRSRCLAS
jgi:phosphate transport system permease protein